MCSQRYTPEFRDEVVRQIYSDYYSWPIGKSHSPEYLR
jgi:hypothetical protein